MIESPNKIIICVLGQTGEGKSKLLNAALSGCYDNNNLLFKEGNTPISCSSKKDVTEIYTNGQKFVLVFDKPGFALEDLECRNQQFLDDEL